MVGSHASSPSIGPGVTEHPLAQGVCDIRPADLTDESDAETYLQLLDQYALDPMGGGKPLESAVRKRLANDLARHPTCLILLAFVDQQPVGVATCFYAYSTFRARPLINVHDIAVLAAYRGQGIGRALLRAIEHEARAQDCCKVTLEVREDNPLAHGLYRSEGFGRAELGSDSVQYLFLEKHLDQPE